MTRRGNAAVNWAQDQVNHPSRDWYRLCQMFVRMSFGLPGGTPNAGLAWDWAKLKHPTRDAGDIPRAVPVFWETPGVADHVAFSLGRGWCLSTDFRRRGKVDRVRIDDITRGWGCVLKGWTADLNGVKIYNGKAAVRPLVDLSDIVKSARRDAPGPQGHTTHPKEVNIVEHALRAEGLLARKYAGDGSFGTTTIDAYSAWQRRLGYRGRDADGIPGFQSLRALGNRHGFRVTK